MREYFSNYRDALFHGHWFDRAMAAGAIVMLVLVPCAAFWPEIFMPHGILLYPIMVGAFVLGAVWSLLRFLLEDDEMPKRKKPELTVEEQAKRFKETARKLGADIESSKKFEEAFEKVVRSKKPKQR